MPSWGTNTTRQGSDLVIQSVFAAHCTPAHLGASERGRERLRGREREGGRERESEGEGERERERGRAREGERERGREGPPILPVWVGC